MALSCSNASVFDIKEIKDISVVIKNEQKYNSKCGNLCTSAFSKTLCGSFGF